MWPERRRGNTPRNLSGARTALDRHLRSREAAMTEGEATGSRTRGRLDLQEPALSDHLTLADLGEQSFVERHIGPDADQVATMLARIGHESLASLMDAAVPAGIRSDTPLDLFEARSEVQAAAELRALAAQNNPLEPMIGLGYHGTITPAVIRRNVLEDPSWYTAYTPYQPEISQGRLEALLNFQTVIG
ncbi:MAG: gcvP, partial [Nocardioidaceae bacterium]|nr:gcvP [Nocardioidaceae bacterium]